jgi:hypothetical protein
MSDINKFTTKEVLNKVLLDSSGNSVAANSHTSQEALNAVLDTSNNRLNVSLGGSNTISGDVTITGDLTVQGGGSLAFDEIIEGTQVIDVDNTEALLVRKDGDGGDVFIVDTTNSRIGINKTPTQALDVSGNILASGASAPSITATDTTNTTSIQMRALDSEVRFGSVTNHPVKIGANSSTTGIVIDTSNNIGIGTASPSSTMHIFNSTADGHLIVESTHASSSGTVDIRSATDRDSFLMFREGTTVKANIFNDSSEDTLVLTDGSNSNTVFIKSNKVGIGIASGDTNLHIHKATAGTIDSNANAQLTIENNSHAGLQFLTPNSANNIIYFGDVDDNDVGYIAYLHSSNEMEFLVDTSVRFKLDANSRISLSNNDSSGEASSTFLGYQAGNAIASGATKNLAIGHQALYQADICDDSIAIGYQALGGTDAGTCGDNIAIGNSAMVANITHVTRSIAIGTEALGSLIGATTPSDNIAIGYRAGNSMTNCSSNIAIGGSSMGEGGGNAITGGNNTAIGTSAMYNAEGAVAGNTAVGSLSLFDITTGSNNVAVGKESGQNLTTGNQNIAIGVQALNTATDVSNVVAIGLYAGLDINSSVADGTVLVGRSAGENIQNGARNTAVGYQAMLDSIGAGDNSVLGYEALKEGTTSEQNVAVGTQALGSNSASALTGNANVAVGHRALYVAQGDSANNVAIGKSAGESITTGSNNTIVGRLTADALTTGSSNIVIGDSALGTATTATLNVAIGGDCMSLVPASVAIQDVVAIGQNAFKGASGTTTGADGTVAIGRDSLKALTSGAGNTAVGYQSLSAETVASQSTAIGYQALGNQVGGSGNVGNIGIGYQAGFAITSGTNNTVIGTSMDQGTCTGTHNTVVGRLVARTLTNGTRNTAVGWNSMSTVTTGDNNVCIGDQSDVSGADAQNQTAIGQGATAVTNNSVTLGNSSVTAVYMAQDSGATVHCAGINFSATQPAPDAGTSSSEVLDGYEEGVFTPTLTTNSTDFTSVTYDSLVKGKYTKIGNIVHIQGFLRTDAVNKGSASGDVAIGGLPFTAGASTSGTANGNASILISNAGGWVGENPSHGLVIAGGTIIQLYYADYNVDANNVAVSDVTDGTSENKNALYFAGTYTV